MFTVKKRAEFTKGLRNTSLSNYLFIVVDSLQMSFFLSYTWLVDLLVNQGGHWLGSWHKRLPNLGFPQPYGLKSFFGAIQLQQQNYVQLY